jgi:hypothetical protein
VNQMERDENEKENHTPIGEIKVQHSPCRLNQSKDFKKGNNCRTPLQRSSLDAPQNSINIISPNQTTAQYFLKDGQIESHFTTPIQNLNKKSEHSSSGNDDLEEFVVYDSGGSRHHFLVGLSSSEENQLKKSDRDKTFLEPNTNFACSPISRFENSDEENLLTQTSQTLELNDQHSLSYPSSPTDSDTSEITLSDNLNQTGSCEESHEMEGNSFDDLEEIIEEAFDTVRSVIESEKNVRDDEEKLETSVQLTSAALQLQREKTRVLEAKLNLNLQRQIDLGDLSFSSQGIGSDCSISTVQSLNLDMDEKDGIEGPSPLPSPQIVELKSLSPRHKYFALSTLLLTFVILWGATIIAKSMTSSSPTENIFPLNSTTSFGSPSPRRNILEDFLEFVGEACPLQSDQSSDTILKLNPKDGEIVVMIPQTSSKTIAPSLGSVQGLPHFLTKVSTTNPFFASSKTNNLPFANSPFSSDSSRRKLIQIIQTKRTFALQKKHSLQSSIVTKFFKFLSSLLLILQSRRGLVDHQRQIN